MKPVVPDLSPTVALLAATIPATIAAGSAIAVAIITTRNKSGRPKSGNGKSKSPKTREEKSNPELESLYENKRHLTIVSYVALVLAIGIFIFSAFAETTDKLLFANAGVVIVNLTTLSLSIYLERRIKAVRNSD